MTPTLPPLGPLPAPKSLFNLEVQYTAEQMQSYATEYGEQCARAAVPEGMALVPVKVVDFLCGRGPLDGKNFGDLPPEGFGPYWWRKYLAAAPTAPKPATPPAVAGAKNAEWSEHYNEIKATLLGTHTIMENLSAMERKVGPLGSHGRGYTHKITKALRHLESLRAALSATPPAVEARDGWVLVPKEIIDRFPEINPSNYDHDDACALNAWGVELVLSAAPAAPQAEKAVGEGDDEYGTQPADVLRSVWNAMQNSADGDDLLSKLEHMRGSIERAVATQPPTQQATLPRLENCGRFLARDNKGQWHYINHAGTWQACPPPLPAKLSESKIAKMMSICPDWFDLAREVEKYYRSEK